MQHGHDPSVITNCEAIVELNKVSKTSTSRAPGEEGGSGTHKGPLAP